MCVYCHDLDRSHAINDETKKQKGYSKTNAGKTDQSRYYYRQKGSQKEEAKGELQRTYGDISRFSPPPQLYVIYYHSRASLIRQLPSVIIPAATYKIGCPPPKIPPL